MKIVHIATYGNGGAGKGALLLHQGLMEIGIDSHIILSQSIDNDIDNVHVFDANIKYQKGKFSKFKYKIKKYLMNRKQAKINQGRKQSHILSFIETGIDLFDHSLVREADIIHLHWTSKFLDWKLFFGNQIIQNKKIFWTIHDRNVFTGGCHITYDCEGYKSTCNNCYQREGTRDINYSGKQLLLKKQLLKDLDLTILTPSTLMGKIMQSSSLFKDKPYSQVIYATDHKVFKALEYNNVVNSIFNIPIANKKIVFISADVNYLYKGFKHLVEATKSFDFEDYQIITIGHPYNGDLDERIVQLGQIREDRLINLIYNYVDLIALPSLEDNLPFVMLEGLSAGTPVVAYPTGGVLDIIEDGIDGYIADEHKPYAFAQKVNLFFRNKSKFNRFSLEKRSKSRFSTKMQANKVLEMYNK